MKIESFTNNKLLSSLLPAIAIFNNEGELSYISPKLISILGCSFDASLSVCFSTLTQKFPSFFSSSLPEIEMQFQKEGTVKMVHDSNLSTFLVDFSKEEDGQLVFKFSNKPEELEAFSYSILYNAIKIIQTGYDIESILWDLSEYIIHFLGFKDCVFYILDPETNLLIQKAACGEKNNSREIKNPISITLGVGVVGKSALIKDTIIVEDIRNELNYIVDLTENRSEMAVPILYKNEVLGIIDSEHPLPNFYQPYHRLIFELLAHLLSSKIAEEYDQKNKRISRFSYKALFENNSTGIAIYDIYENKRIDCNKKTCEIFNCTKEEYLRHSKEWKDLDGKDFLEETATKFKEEVFQKTLVKGFHTTEVETENFQGEDIYLEITISKLSEVDNRFLMIIFVDITDRKKIEKEFQEQQKYLEAILNSAPLLFFHKNKNNVILNGNKSSAKSMGIPFDKLKGAKTEDYFPLDLAKEYLKADLEVINSGKPLNGLIENFISGGTQMWVKTDKVPYKNAAGKIDSVLIYATDITEMMLTQQALHSTKEELRKRLIELDEKNKMLEEYINSNLQLENFAYMASHDLKEPLRNISGFAQIISTNYGHLMDEKGNEFLHFIISSITNMNNLVEDLLEYSKVNTEHNPDEFEVIPVFLMFEEIIRSLGPSVQENEGEIIIEDVPSIIFGNLIRIRQIFQNLISNALKFKKPGVPPVITISGSENEQFYYFDITDNGIGIKEDYFEKIFLLFRRLHTRDKYSGSGIGLAICKKIVDQHHGDIKITSEVGKGTTFTIKLKKQAFYPSKKLDF